jgi:hypothetical protein
MASAIGASQRFALASAERLALTADCEADLRQSVSRFNMVWLSAMRIQEIHGPLFG